MIAYTTQSVLLIGLIAGAAYGFTMFLQEPDAFHVKTIGVAGARVLPEADIVAHSGVSKADNILLLDAARIEERLELLPYVRSCTVTRVFPDKVVIRIEERTAVATLLQEGRSFEIDAETVVLRELQLADEPVGPYISNVSALDPVVEGQQLDQHSLEEALRVWTEFQRLDMANDLTVSELAAYNPNDIRMYCEELPFEIRWGRRNYEEQGQRLDVLWAKDNKTLDCEAYIDTRFEPNLYLR
jgi:cell division septal protein FtsQ